VNRRESEFDIWWRIGLPTVGRIYRSSLHVVCTGLEHLPRSGPAIVASNHLSVLDPVGLALVGAARGRAIRYLAGVEFFGHPVWGPGLRIMKQIPISRGTRDLGALDELTAVLRTGGLAGIFPEGRVGQGDGPLRGRSGMVRVALATGAPIVPVGIWGTQARWPPGASIRLSLPWRVPVAVAVGAPIDVPPDARSPGGIRQATREVMTVIEDLAGRCRVAVQCLEHGEWPR
jgi:1-acyl-sn-glycerol-3-phosphate acyltransferase